MKVSSIRRWRKDPRALALVVAIGLLALMACGSTVQDRSQLSQRQGNVPVDEFGNPIPGATGTGGTFVPGQPGSTIGGGPGGFVPGTGGRTSSGRNGPGVTSDSIAIGISYCADQQAAARALGFNPAPSDERRAWDIVVEDTNKHGGIGGRKVVPVYEEIDDCSATTHSASQLHEASSNHFTRDHKVFAVMGGPGEGGQNFIVCVTRAGSVIIDNNVTDSDKLFLRQYPHNIQPSSLAVDSAARLEVAALKSQGYFNVINPATFPTLKIGILVWNTPGFERTLNGALLPALRQAGYSVSSENIAMMPHINRFDDVAALSAAISSAVLQFNARKVSHVLFLQARGTLTLLFLREAESQNYFPRYGFNSQDAPQAVVDFTTTGGDRAVSPRNFNNSLGIGWSPLFDLPRSPVSAGPPERIECSKLLTSRGYKDFGDSNAEVIALNVCDSMAFLKLSVERAGAVVNQSTWLAAVNGIRNNRYRGTNSLGYSLLLPTKHDGNNQYRTYEFDEKNRVFRYTGPNIAIGF